MSFPPNFHRGILTIIFMAGCCLFAHAQNVPQDENFRQGLLALKESHFEEALSKLTAASSEHPKDAKVHNFLGITLTSLGRNEQAIAEYKNAIHLDSTLQDAYRNLGFLEWTDHQLAAASADLKVAVELSPTDSFARHYLGRVYLETQNYPEALAELNRSKTALPADPAFLLQISAAYISTRRPEEAKRSLSQLISQPLTDQQAARTAFLLLRNHENDAAIDLLNKIGAAKPWAQFDLVIAYLFAHEYQNASDSAGKYLDDSPPDPVAAWSLIGIANAHMGRIDPSVDGFRKAAKLSPSNEETWLNLTRELMEASRYPEAIAAVQEGLVANPKSYALHLRLGAACLSISRYLEAEAAFRELVAAGDPLPTSYVGLAQVLLRTGRAEEAASELTSAQKKLGSSFLLSYFRGLALVRVAKPAEALAAFQEALKEDPDSTEAQMGVGETQLKLGKLTEAIVTLRKIADSDSKDKQARRLLSTAYRRAGDIPNATKYAQPETADPTPPAKDLIGDFFMPEWQSP
ncbi:MAG TPA: tetratricopeptide repeat protein [Terriglobales bacterium]|nr:tetratricopeptide repeat protein [Terriglobales bacterium]